MANSTKSQKTWMQRHLKDAYVKASKRDGYRSRASYKLIELQDKFKCLRKGMRIADLGAAPGGWSQLAKEYVGPQGQIWALDLLSIKPISGVNFIQGDFTDEVVQQKLLSAIGEDAKLDWVLSDLAPNLSGIRDLDQANSLELLENVWDFAQKTLKPQGGMIVKAFQGQDTEHFVKGLKGSFKQVSIKKPQSSRAESKEIYLLARGYNI